MNVVPQENIYAHQQRLFWLRDQLSKTDRALEFGCGTGRMIALPLRSWGYDVIGVDLDPVSIEHGRALFRDAGLDEDALIVGSLEEVPGRLDAVIASEVLEHLTDDELAHSLELIRAKLEPGGKLIVTVPNGYGLFELETFLWYRGGVDRVYRRLSRGRLAERMRSVKEAHTEWAQDPSPMTLADSPHKQRFTWASIHGRLGDAGFQVRKARGAMLFCGPATDLAFSGVPRVMQLNKRLGKRFPRVASDFYLVAERL